MSEDNKGFGIRLVEELWNKRNVSALERFYSPDIVRHWDQAPDIRGIESMRQHVTSILTAFPDFRLTAHDWIAEGDKLVVRWTSRGTHKNEFLGIGATGKQISGAGTTTHRLAGGKIVEEWINWDALGLMQQLGVVTLPTSR